MPPLTIRAVTPDDVDATVALLNHWDQTYMGVQTANADNVLRQWQRIDLATSTRAAFTTDGHMVGCAAFYDDDIIPVRPHIDVWIHSDYYSSDLGSQLFAWALELAPRVLDRVPADARVVLESTSHAKDRYYQKLLINQGFKATGQAWCRMVTHMEAEPPAPQWPAGIQITTYAEWGDDLRTLYDAVDDAFKDHRGYIEEPPDEAFEHWQQRVKLRTETDTALWFMAMDGGEIAGVSLCHPSSRGFDERGYVWILGVRRPYRQKGLGLALLRHSLRTFWQRGKRSVDLFVDGSSITGATRVYERGGMHIEHTFETHERELRPGRELSNQG
jgi:mycothiol synthase